MPNENQTNPLKPSDCVLSKQQQEDLHLEYLDDSLAGEKRRSYERHLTSCEHCQELVQLHKALAESMEAWTVPEVSSDFDARLFAKIRAEDRSVPFWQALFGNWQWMLRPAMPLAVLALCAIAVFSYRVLQPEWNAWNSPAESQARLEDRLIDKELRQVERALEDMEALHALTAANSDSAVDGTTESTPAQAGDSSKKSL